MLQEDGSTRTLVIESMGRYVITLSGVMTPGEVFVNGEQILTAYGPEPTDISLLTYLMPGDTVLVSGTDQIGIKKVEYTSNV